MYRKLETFLGYFDGRFYYNLETWCTLISHLPGFSENPKLLQEMMGVRPEDRISVVKVKISTFAKLRVLAKFLYYHFALPNKTDRWVADFDADFRQRMAKLDGITDAHKAMQFFFEVEDRFLRDWQIPILNDFAVMIYSGSLRRLNRKYLQQELDPKQISNLGESGNTRMVTALRRIADEVKADRQLLEDFSTLDNVQLWDCLEAHPTVGPLLRDFLSEFGLRNGHDLKLETPNLREDPAFLLELVRQYIMSSPSGEDSLRAAPPEEGIEQLPLFKRLVLNFFIKHTRRSMRRREEMRLKRSQTFGAVRQVFLIIGSEFARQGLIDDPKDIFYLEMDEVFQVLQGTSTLKNLGVLVSERRNELDAAEQYQLMPHFATQGVPFLDRSRVAHDEGTPLQRELTGSANYPAVVTGEVVVMEQPDFSQDVKDKILVCKQTDPSWVPFLGLVKGIIVERGGILSHAAIVSRELKVPSVIGVANATRVLKSGQQVRLDSAAGKVVVL
jgi:phosphohistidine swiveling domain-containing protein